MDPSEIVLIGFFSTFIHELGHILAIIYRKHYINEITIGFFHIDITDAKRNLITYNDDIFILLSGSFLNFFVSLICLILYITKNISIMKFTFYSNLLIAIINLFPISTLDGGQILYLFLSKKFSIDKSETISEIISFIFLLPLSIMGFLILFKSKYNFSLLFICCFLVGILVFKNEKFREFSYNNDR